MNGIFKVIGIILISTHALYAQETGIQFQHDKSWDEILLMAQQQDKLVFLDAYTNWCGPCRWMAANVFTNDTVGDFFNEHFINAKIDMDSEQGKLIRELYQVQAFPTLLFVNGVGEMAHRACGARDVEGFMLLGKDALNPEKQFSQLIRQYDSGDSSEAFILTYIPALNSAGMLQDAGFVYESFLTGKETEKFLSPEIWGLIYENCHDISSREFKYVMENYDSYVKLSGEDSVMKFVEDRCFGVIMQVLYVKEIDQEVYHNRIKEIKNLHYRNSEKLIDRFDLMFYHKIGDITNYTNNVFGFVEKYNIKDADELNNLAWDVYELNEDIDILKKACAMAKMAVEISEVDYNLDTYARLLYVAGNKSKAIEMEQKALKMAKEKGDERSAADYNGIIEKMKAGTNIKDK